MNKELRRVSMFVLLMFLALFASSSIIQVLQQDALQADGRNVRVLYASFNADRGAILASDGTVIAQTVPSDGEISVQRVYPEGELYSPVTGYFTLNQGTTGIEAEFNDYLSGTANEQFLDQLTAIFTGQQPKGAAVRTTIDPVVQRAAWDALAGRSGAVVALDPATGRILAMVSSPTFDPNALAVHDTEQVITTYNGLLADPGDPLINRAIAGDLNPPGSTFKLVVATAALESGEYSADSQLPNPPSLQLPQSDTVITNSGGSVCGGAVTATIATAIRLSCNIIFAELGAELGATAVGAQAEAFGFGDDSLGIPIPVEPSVYPTPESDAQLMLSAFGQANVRATPLQMAMVSAAVANGGVLQRPTLVDSIIGPDLSPIDTVEPEIYNTAMSSTTADAMTAMMLAAVSNGVSSNARISGVDVAGKTGTAEDGQGSYSLWFTGFAPADDPQVAVAVVLENAEGFGNTVAAPIARAVMEAVLNR